MGQWGRHCRREGAAGAPSERAYAKAGEALHQSESRLDLRPRERRDGHVFQYLARLVFHPVRRRRGDERFWRGGFVEDRAQVGRRAAAEADGQRRPRRALAARQEERHLEIAALQELIPKIVEKIASRRLAFEMNDDEEEAAIEVTHTASEEVIGFIYADEGEFVFESNQDGYFDDFVDEDVDSFVSRLYETLRADLPKFEVEAGE